MAKRRLSKIERYNRETDIIICIGIVLLVFVALGHLYAFSLR